MNFFVHTGIDTHFDITIPYISVFILFLCRFVWVFLLAHVAETHKENFSLEIRDMQRGKINSDHYIYVPQQIYKISYQFISRVR